MRFGRDYREPVILPTGARVRLRLLRRHDAPLLVQIFEGLSAEARYQRFFAHKNALSLADLSTLTDCDGERQLAIVATANASGVEEGVGVARFVRLREDPRAAEVAVAVVDARRREGIGRQLIRRLAEAALERNIERLHSVVLADNLPMKALLQQLAPGASAGTSQLSGATVSTFEVPLPLPG